MTFTLLPAIDVADGRASRLVQGRVASTEADNKSTYGHPRDVALTWQAEGAEWIHLVDLDAAFRRGSNSELLTNVIGHLDIKTELSGGICNNASLERALSSGCDRIILATAALDDLAWCARAIATHGDRIAISLDVSIVDNQNLDPMPYMQPESPIDGSSLYRLIARGSTLDRGDLWENLAKLDEYGCARYVVTDVSKDGMMDGPNVELYRAMASVTKAKVIASGGISSIADLVILAEFAASRANLEGTIVGKALYAGRFTLDEALATMRRMKVSRKQTKKYLNVQA